MATFLITLVFTLIISIAVVVLMAIGVLKGRQPIRGSCGGLSGKSGCEICGDDPNLCEETQVKK